MRSAGVSFFSHPVYAAVSTTRLHCGVDAGCSWREKKLFHYENNVWTLLKLRMLR